MVKIDKILFKTKNVLYVLYIIFKKKIIKN